ncbi:S66 family peptidase [Brevibacillus fulvus]|uniref:Muramoyltetrapeptide carboxypeptidase LdcA involved in peptidoglycan recycling n=1 Tax=Brevibacillus fulvus TaxID=1125967 RepID=A0A938Y0L6_9BACL|nr:S66 peptidase family protein [Brevibacillus fulvus]MBM7590998.1 muramoyltetrapeptide carboxypeptidase LdcA involved in peptidoglycan recycling [Brevibacillus fulvus]
MKPTSLQHGDEIRVIAPSKSLAIIEKDAREIAAKRLEMLGFRVSFGRRAEERDEFDSSSVEARLADLHEAFHDPNVKGVLAATGGFNANQLLAGLDYKLIQQNPKIFCGYSDITALANAIYAKTGLITYSGPNFSSFGMMNGFEYTLEHFQKCLMDGLPFELSPSSEWSDDSWYRDQQNRRFFPNGGYEAIRYGSGAGRIVGGNLCTLNLLQGTPYMPSLDGAILFLEDDHEVTPETFDRDLQSLLHVPDSNGIRGLVIGRFQRASGMTVEKLQTIIASKPELNHIPVIANADFGHTTPIFTFPIGGYARLEAAPERVQLWIE